jgi:peptidoglycan/LPS O-acetylase OafA/YrhL
MTALPASVEEAGGAAKAAAGAERFLLLDGLRGLAAFAVILDHTPANVLGNLVPGRYLAVDFFFVLSGFVLAHAYGSKLEGGWSVFSFMRARVIRLYPLYFAGFVIGLALSVILILRGWDATPLEQVAVMAAFGVLFLPAPPLFDFGGGHLFPFNGPSWSLFFELVANFIYGLIARVLGWRLLSAILIVGAIAVAFTVMRHQGVGGPGWLWGHFDAALARVVFDFFAGVALFRMRGRFRFPVLPAIIPVLAFLAVIAAPAAAEWRAAYDVAAAIVLMPLLVAFASEAKVGHAVGRACVGLGALSYGVYVLHVPLLNLINAAAQMAQIELPALVVVGLIVLIAGTAAALLNHLYDAPVRRWLTRNLPGGANR